MSEATSDYLNLPLRTYAEACKQVDWSRLERLRVQKQIDQAPNVVVLKTKKAKL